MIPILYEKGEAAFQSNGLGRLTDCISFKVVEERNNIYEADFAYPVGGWLFDRIQLGRIIAVTHDETGDLQPFDIVSYSKPIDGIVTFHAVHISYRLTKAVSYATNVSSLAQALGLLSTTEFTFSSDMTSSAYMAAFDGIPKSIRQLVGGTEGSLLDTYGGELEWNRFNVILHASRGQKRNFAIRYGVNMTGYQDDTDYSDSFNACVPYWIKDDVIVIGNETSSGAQTAGGRTEVVPLDLSTMFEDEPTTAQLEAAALDYMREKGAHLPQQNIKVDFVRLQDLGHEELGALMKCNLCDTIDVIFPAYGMRGTYKIVRTVWDVLSDRYEEMELGSLRTTLSEAIGITNTPQAAIKYHAPKEIVSDTTANWAAQTTLVSEKDVMYVYTDYRTDDGVIYPAVKIGDGLAYVVDLPFIDEPLWTHIRDTDIHITAAERTFWNNKNRAYAVGEELILTTL